MTSEKPSVSHAFQQSVGLLWELHELTKLGDEASPRADEIREAMEQPWYSLSSKEQSLIRGLSADLKALDRPAGALPPVADTLQREIQALCDQMAWVQLLERLISAKEALPDFLFHYLEGLAWLNLGFPVVGLEFLQAAVRRRPDTEFIRSVYLVALMKTGKVTEAGQLAEEIVATTMNPIALLNAAAVQFAAANLESDEFATPLIREAKLAVQRAYQRAVDTGLDHGIAHMLSGGFLLSAVASSRLGDTKGAIADSRKALEIDPDNLNAYMVLGVLEHSSNPSAAQDRLRQRLFDKGTDSLFDVQALQGNVEIVTA
jgi:tetratricopeptide (TPR) repeat protein